MRITRKGARTDQLVADHLRTRPNLIVSHPWKRLLKVREASAQQKHSWSHCFTLQKFQAIYHMAQRFSDTTQNNLASDIIKNFTLLKLIPYWILVTCWTAIWSNQQLTTRMKHTKSPIKTNRAHKWELFMTCMKHESSLRGVPNSLQGLLQEETATCTHCRRTI